MLQDFFDSLSQWFDRQNRVELTPIPNDNDGTMILKKPNGETEMLRPSLQPTVIHTSCLREYIRIVNEAVLGGGKETGDHLQKEVKDPVISTSLPMQPDLYLISRFYFDRRDPRGYVQLTLGTSWLYDFILKLYYTYLDREVCDPPASCWSVKEMYNFLRYRAYPYVRNPEEVLKAVGHLKTITEANAHANRTAGTFTGGIDTKSSVQDVDKLPTGIPFTFCPLHDVLANDPTIHVTLHIEPDPEMGKWFVYVTEKIVRSMHMQTLTIVTEALKDMPDEVPQVTGMSTASIKHNGESHPRESWHNYRELQLTLGGVHPED